MNRRYTALVLGGMCVLATLSVLRLSGTERAGDRIQVETAEVTSGTIERRVMVTGSLKPERAVEVGSQVSGTIASIEADFNSLVRAGQVLARLDPAGFQGQLEEAQAGVAQARGEHARLQVVLGEAQKKLARTETLAGDELMARAELDLARTTARQAEAAVKAGAAAVAAADAAVEHARVRLARTTIRSPIDGVVVNRHVDVGQTITASVEAPILFTIADLRRMQLLAEVAEPDVGGVRPGSVVTFNVESLGNEVFEGRVATVRLQPVAEGSVALTAGATSATASPVGTSGASAPGSQSQSPGSASTTGSGSSGSSAAASGTQSSPSNQAGASPAQSSQQTSTSSSGVGSTASAARGSGSSATRTGVVTYTAVVEVDNVEGRVPPGGTAVITLGGGQRTDATRIPNNALSFHPSPEALAAIKQQPPTLNRPAAPQEKKSRGGTRHGHVWKFEQGRFVPVPIETGIADDAWTELVAGSLSPGDRLVTAAAGRR